jgi:hypothetical protein
LKNSGIRATARTLSLMFKQKIYYQKGLNAKKKFGSIGREIK